MMSLADFTRHLKKQGCEVTPLEGRNLTGIAIKIHNPHKNKSYILTLYKGGMLSDTTIKEVCMMRLV
jgi:hypothetical protein